MNLIHLDGEMNDERKKRRQKHSMRSTCWANKFDLLYLTAEQQQHRFFYHQHYMYTAKRKCFQS